MKVDEIDDNPFTPGMVSVNQSIADKLIGGNLKVVTTAGVLDSGALKRGFVVGQIDASGNWIACVKTATDGSQVPRGLLVDYADASSGPVDCSILQQGEVNVRAVSFDSSWAIADLEVALRYQKIVFKHIAPAMSNDDPS